MQTHKVSACPAAGSGSILSIWVGTWEEEECEMWGWGVSAKPCPTHQATLLMPAAPRGQQGCPSHAPAGRDALIPAVSPRSQAGKSGRVSQPSPSP